MKRKTKNMKDTNELLHQFFTERNSSQNTKYAYLQTIRLFEDFTKQTLPNILYLAEMEQEKNTNWKHQTIKMQLINFRAYLFENYKIKSAQLHLSRTIAVLRHFEITIEKLPYYSVKSGNPSIPINPDKLIDREILRLCINMKNPLLKAVTLFMSSSGMSKVDTLNLTIQDYMKATSQYHEFSEDIYSMINDMRDNKEIVAFWENPKRQKTGQVYFTFSSPESSTAINQYLLSRENVTLESPLFDVSYKYLSDLFKETNDKLHLGKNGNYSRFAAHMLRRYHATQLIESGMSVDKVDLLQGRKPQNIAYRSYVKIRPSKLKQEYIKALPYLVIEDYHKVKSELDVEKEKNSTLLNENISLKNELLGLSERQDNLEKLVLGGISDEKLAKLHKLL